MTYLVLSSGELGLSCKDLFSVFICVLYIEYRVEGTLFVVGVLCVVSVFLF